MKKRIKKKIKKRILRCVLNTDTQNREYPKVCVTLQTDVR